MSSEADILRIEGVTKRFGGLIAVNDVTLSIARGSITALIGPNGAGKSTLFNVVSGFMPADAGIVHFNDHRIDRLPAHKRTRLGLVRTFQMARVQTVEQFRTLTDGSLDIGFTRTPHRYPTGLTGFTIDRQKFVLALPEKHHLASQKKITQAMLVNEGFVAASLESELGFWANLSAVAPQGVSLKIVARAPDVFTVIALVASGAGLAVLSDSLQRITMPGMVYREVEGATRTSDHIVAYRKNETEPVVKAFINFLRAGVRGS